MDETCRLGRLLQSKLNSIEILPGDGKEWLEAVLENRHSPFLFVDNNLGVPEKHLYKLYMVATKALDLKGAKLNLQSPEERDKSIQLTAVILFANPSHQTVLNFRKTLVMDEVLDASAELCFIKRLFTVKQPAKVSTLWHHRRWLLQYQINRKGVLSYGDDDQFERTRIPADVLGGEFLLATSSSSIYPRNYHAWLHRTLCMRCALDQARTSNEHLDRLVEDRVTTMKWIDLHVSDYSAIHYFVNLSVGLDGLELLRGDRKRCFANEVQDHAQDLLARYPSHESIWMYNRLLEDSPLKKYLPPQTASEEMMVADRMEQRMSCEELCIDERIYRSHVRHHLAWKASRKGDTLLNGHTMRSIILGDDVGP